MKSISVIVPLFNEEKSLDELYRAVSATVDQLTEQAEFIFVDDGSRDGSFEVLKTLQSRDARVKIIRFRRNFGKSAALSAGFRFAKGEIVVTLDADLQDQPSEIAKLIARLEEGCDLVSGWKKKRRDPWRKRWPSKVFNKTVCLLTGLRLHDINCGLKAYRSEVIREIKVYGEMHRFIPVLASYRGFLVDEVPVRHEARKFGKSKYGAARFISGFFDLLTVVMLSRYNSKPLHIFGVLGSALLGIGGLIEAYLGVGWVFGQWIQNRPLFLYGILLLIVGAQFIFFGLLAEMVAYSSKREDDYSIREVVVAEVREEGPVPAASE